MLTLPVLARESEHYVQCPWKRSQGTVKLKGGNHLAQPIYFIDVETEGPEEAFNSVNSPLES